MPGSNATTQQADYFCCVKCLFHVLIVIVPALPRLAPSRLVPP